MGWNVYPVIISVPSPTGIKAKKMTTKSLTYLQVSRNAKMVWSLLELFTLLGQIMLGMKLCVLIRLFMLNVVKLHQFHLLWWYYVMPTSCIFWLKLAPKRWLLPRCLLRQKLLDDLICITHTSTEDAWQINNIINFCVIFPYFPPTVGKCYKNHLANQSSTGKEAPKNDMAVVLRCGQEANFGGYFVINLYQNRRQVKSSVKSLGT